MNKKVLKSAIDTYGFCAQQDVAIEEMSELTKALLKFRRFGNLVNPELKEKLRADIAEEVADVLITVEQVIMMYEIHDDVQKNIEIKVERLKNRLENED